MCDTLNVLRVEKRSLEIFKVSQTKFEKPILRRTFARKLVKSDVNRFISLSKVVTIDVRSDTCAVALEFLRRGCISTENNSCFEKRFC